MKTIFTILIIAFCAFQINAQNGVAINTSGAIAEPSAILDVSSSSSGLLIPRMSKSQKLAILSPATGLIVYQTDDTTGFWYYKGSAWELMGAEKNGGSLASGTSAGSTPYWDGTKWVVNSTNIFNNGSSVGIGTSNPDPSAAFEISSSTKGTLITRMTTTDRNNIVSPVGGLQIYNTTTKCFEFFENNIWQKLICACALPDQPTEGVHIPDYNFIVWNWSAVYGAIGYKYNTINDYNSAIDNGVSTTFTQHGLISNTPNTLYVWAYGTCGETASVQLTSTTLNNDPASISGVYLWWDADNASSITFSSGSSVSAWADKSGNNYTATQSNPAFQPTLVNNAIGSKPAMRFVASIGSYLINSTFSINLANRTMFVVTKENELVTYSGIISMRGSSPDYLSNNGYIFGNANNGSTYNMINNRSYYNITPATTTGSGTMLPAGIYAEVVGSGTGISYFNGVPFSITGNSSNSTNSLGGILMGRRYDTGSPGIISSSGYFTGDIAEVIMYDRALSNSEKNLVGSYLSNKYSLTWTP